MTLATHMVTGATAAAVFSSHPVEAFFIGWASHYVFDAIPHWDYSLASFSSDSEKPLDTKVTFNRFLFLDIGKVLLDVLIGALVVYFLSVGVNTFTLTILFFGAIGGVVPDFLQFLYGFIKIPILRSFQQFHNFTHSKKKLDHRPLIGITSQVLIIALAGTILLSTV